jgi:hypothetical protein
MKIDMPSNSASTMPWMWSSGAIRNMGRNTQSSISHATNRYRPWKAWNRTVRSRRNFSDARTMMDAIQPIPGI